MKYGQNIGVDFGTSNFLAFVRDKGVVICEPAVAARERSNGKIAAIGVEAQKIMKRFPEAFDAVYPIKNGVIIEYKVAAQMLEKFLKKVCMKQILKPKVTVGIPIRAGEVAERAMLNAVLDAGAISVTPLREPFAAASGIGMDLSLGKGTMIIDIGAGTTDISVISMGKMAVGTSTEAAGNRMDQEILKYIRKETGLEVGERVAENIKITVGCLIPKSKDVIIQVKGRNLKNGLPEEREISSDVFPKILSPVAEEICDYALEVLERIPPEIREEIQNSGIFLTGGGSMTDGLEQFLSDKIGVLCKKTKSPLHTIAVGAGMWQ